MAQPDEDFFQYSSRWAELRRLATGDPKDEILTDKLISLLEERDKELEYFLENRITTADIGGSGIGWRIPPLYVSGRWYRTAANADPDTSSGGVLEDVVWYAPFIAPYEVTITDIAIDTSTTGGNIRMGVYSTDTTGIWKPGDLREDFGSKSVTSGGGVEINSLSHTIGAAVPVYFAYQSDTSRSLSVLGPESSPSSGLTAAGNNSPQRGAYTSDTYASGLPSTAGTLVSHASAGVVSFRFKHT